VGLRSDRHDRDTDFHDSCPLGDSRSWVFSLAMAQVVDVATGTRLNLPFYPRNVQLTGIDFNPATLALSGEAGQPFVYWMTLNWAIMSWSSCSTLWQWKT
jgi:hypothetical protein